MALTALRRHGTLAAVLDHCLERPLPTDAVRARSILLCAAAQILVLGTPPHAAINLAVEQCRRDRHARRFDKLANAVLRRLAREGPAVIAKLDTVRLDVPGWLLERWARTFGESTALEIAKASLLEAPLDLSVKADPQMWAERLGGRALPTATVRVHAAGRVEELDGYSEGAWWVQDAAAALPARLLGPVSGLRVADLCAAPGGKTAQLAAAGARVTSVDQSPTRLALVSRNLQRLRLAGSVEVIAADIEQWSPASAFEAVVLDAPCSATGTIRRHPDVLHLKRPEDIARAASVQARLLARAATFVDAGGRLVYCTCSLEPEEGVDQVERFLREQPEFERRPIEAQDLGIDPTWLTRAGDLQTLPCHLSSEAEPGGMDGFYTAVLQRRL